MSEIRFVSSKELMQQDPKIGEANEDGYRRGFHHAIIEVQRGVEGRALTKRALEDFEDLVARWRNSEVRGFVPPPDFEQACKRRRRKA